MRWPKTDATHYHAQLGIPDKGRAIKVLVVSNNWDIDIGLAKTVLPYVEINRPLTYES